MSKENQRSCRQFTWSVDRLPIPRQQLTPSIGRMDAGEDVGQPRLGIDAVHLGGLCRPPNLLNGLGDIRRSCGITKCRVEVLSTPFGIVWPSTARRGRRAVGRLVGNGLADTVRASPRRLPSGRGGHEGRSASSRSIHDRATARSRSNRRRPAAAPSRQSSGNSDSVFGRSSPSSNTSIDRRQASSCESLISPR